MTVHIPVVRNLAKQILDRGIGYFNADPFLRTHRVSENDNPALDEAAAAWGEVAEMANAAIGVCHHTRKVAAGQEVTVEDSRGGVALTNASRDVRTLNRMTAGEAKQAGVDVDERKSYLKVTKGDKSNFASATDDAEWYRFVGVPLGNGEDVGVLTPWKWPSAFADIATGDLFRVQKRIAEGQWRKSERCENWAGRAVAEVLEYDIGSDEARKAIRRMLKIWTENKALKVTKANDSKRMPREWVEVGEWANDMRPSLPQ